MPFVDKHMDYILKVARTGSITEAASQLYISQPALSQVIRNVEKELGGPIFNRSVQPMQLTDIGREYISAVNRVNSIRNDMTRHINEIIGNERGTLRIGVSVQRGLHVLPKILPVFLGRYPHIRIVLEEYGSNILEQMVINGECDFAMITAMPDNSKLTYDLIENEEIMLVAGSRTKLAQTVPSGTPIHLKDAVGERFVSLAPGHSIRDVQESLFRKIDIRPEIIVESHNFEACRRLTVLLNAVMLCPNVYVSKVPDLDLSSALSVYPILDAELTRHFYLCYRSDTRLTPAMSAFIGIVRTCL